MLALPDDAVNIFTDGSSKQGPRRGGIAFRIVTTGEDGHEQVHDESPDGYRDATNNQMELQACIEALDFLRARRCPIDLADFRKVIVYTDSTYVQKHIGTAINQWSGSRWMRRSGPPVLNAERWQELIRAMKRIAPVPVNFEWVPGKSSEHTKAVDRLAKDSADRPYNRPLAVTTVRPKLSDRETEPGVVPMQGQTVDVYIIEVKPLRVQRTNRYRYRLVSGDLEGAIDFAYSDENLRARHTYRVRFNEDSAYPQILESLHEVEVQSGPP